MTLFSLTGITFQNKDKYSTQYNYSTLQLEYLFLTKIYKDSDMHAHRLDLLELLVDACCRLDRSEAMTKYKLVISTKGIMILVLWEENFKSLEADYSNHLTSPLIASGGEISPSPRIRCDKFKSPTRDAVLGHLETGHPKNRTQCGVTHPLKPCLIGICKDMMS